jgi:hypothetical protein
MGPAISRHARAQNAGTSDQHYYREMAACSAKRNRPLGDRRGHAIFWGPGNKQRGRPIQPSVAAKTATALQCSADWEMRNEPI